MALFRLHTLELLSVLRSGKQRVLGLLEPLVSLQPGLYMHAELTLVDVTVSEVMEQVLIDVYMILTVSIYLMFKRVAIIANSVAVNNVEPGVSDANIVEEKRGQFLGATLKSTGDNFMVLCLLLIVCRHVPCEYRFVPIDD